MFIAMPSLAVAAPAAPQVLVRFDPSLGALHGRLLVFLTRGPVKDDLEPGYERPRDVEVLGAEVDGAPAGSTIAIGMNADCYPTPLQSLAPGRYVARAELDVQHPYTYDGGQPGDPTSGNVRVTITPQSTIVIDVSKKRRAELSQGPAAPAPPGARWERFISPAFSTFFGRPVAMNAYVVPPPGYATGTKRYATVYAVGGYGATRENTASGAARRLRLLARNGGTSLIYVFLDPHGGLTVTIDRAMTAAAARATTTPRP